MVYFNRALMPETGREIKWGDKGISFHYIQRAPFVLGSYEDKCNRHPRGGS